jgi:hypothetical protein
MRLRIFRRDRVFPAQICRNFIQTAKRNYGLDIAYTSLWNEKVYDTAYAKELYRTCRESTWPPTP